MTTVLLMVGAAIGIAAAALVWLITAAAFADRARRAWHHRHWWRGHSLRG